MTELRQVYKGFLANPARVVLAGYFILAFWLYGQIFGFLPRAICPLKAVLHLPCPGCGATRAFLLAIRGQVLPALRINPLGLAALVLAVGFLPVVAVLCFFPIQARHCAMIGKRILGTWLLRIILAAAVFGSWAWVLHQHFHQGFRY